MSKLKESRLDSLVKALNNSLGRPGAAYTRDDDGNFHANIGNLSFGQQSPGDGATRYTLEEIVNEGGGVRTYWSVLGRGNAEDVLCAMLDTLRLVRSPDWIAVTDDVRAS